MIPDITTELQEFSNDYIKKLTEVQSPEFVVCMLQATKMRASIALMAHEKKSEDEIDNFIQTCSETMANATTLLGIEPKAVMDAADAFYDATHAYANGLFKQKEH